MSAPDTNVERQENRHKGPLLGIKVVMTFVVLLFVGLILWTSYDAGAPDAVSPAELVSGSD